MPRYFFTFILLIFLLLPAIAFSGSTRKEQTSLINLARPPLENYREHEIHIGSARKKPIENHPQVSLEGFHNQHFMHALLRNVSTERVHTSKDTTGYKYDELKELITFLITPPSIDPNNPRKTRTSPAASKEITSVVHRVGGREELFYIQYKQTRRSTKSIIDFYQFDSSGLRRVRSLQDIPDGSKIQVLNDDLVLLMLPERDRKSTSVYTINITSGDVQTVTCIPVREGVRHMGVFMLPETNNIFLIEEKTIKKTIPITRNLIAKGTVKNLLDDTLMENEETPEQITENIRKPYYQYNLATFGFQLSFQDMADAVTNAEKLPVSFSSYRTLTTTLTCHLTEQMNVEISKEDKDHFNITFEHFDPYSQNEILIVLRTDGSNLEVIASSSPDFVPKQTSKAVVPYNYSHTSSLPSIPTTLPVPRGVTRNQVVKLNKSSLAGVLLQSPHLRVNGSDQLIYSKPRVPAATQFSPMRFETATPAQATKLRLKNEQNKKDWAEENKTHEEDYQTMKEHPSFVLLSEPETRKILSGVIFSEQYNHIFTTRTNRPDMIVNVMPSLISNRIDYLISNRTTGQPLGRYSQDLEEGSEALKECASCTTFYALGNNLLISVPALGRPSLHVNPDYLLEK